MNKRGFASDNNSGVHSVIMNSITDVNIGHTVGYGDDVYTKKAVELFKEHFGKETEVFFVFNGTGANILGLKSLTRSFNSIICPSTAHIMVDECGAPEHFTNCKLLPIDVPNGKLTPELILPHLTGFDFEHHAQPGIISISQSTELGTVYTINEIKAITDLAHKNGMFVHLDGARIANAAVALGEPFKAFTRDAGVDVVSFGGTKNGMMFGEAVLFFNPELAKFTKYYRKQAAQLYSKMRFVAAQFIAYFENDLWKTNAQHSNSMALLLESKVLELGVQITQKVEANGVFAVIENEIRDELQKEYFFYPWNETTNEVRWMTSFDTTVDDIENFTSLLQKLLQNK